MPGSNRGLPFGRPANQPPQNQFLDERARSLPAQNGALISTAPIYATIIAAAQTANLAILFALPIYDRDIIVSEARIRVTGASAGQNARVALFVFDSAERLFSRVPGTEITFSTTSTGLLSLALPKAVRLEAGIFYFAAFKASDAVATFAGVDASIGGTSRLLYKVETAGSFNSALKLRDLTRTTGTVPVITYVSPLWKDVI